MRSEFRYKFLTKTKRLLLLMGLIFSLVLFFQYTELPYSNILSTLFSSSKFQESPMDDFSRWNSSRNPNSIINSTLSLSLNVKDDFTPQNVSHSDDTLDPEDELTSNEFVENSNNSSNINKAREFELPVSNDTSESNSRPPEKYDEKVINQPLPVILSPSNMKPQPENIPSQLNFPTSKRDEKPEPAVVTISEMNNMLLKSRVSYRAKKPRWSSTVDQELLNAKSLIENAPIIRKDPYFDVNLYRNFSAFIRSYELMERILKVYIYSDGERPIFHQPPLKGIYASEGWFMKQIKSNKKFATKNPKKAHLFYLPFSSRELEISLYVPDSHSRKNLIQFLNNYVKNIKTKYNFWNRTNGADHFLVACHDWAPAETKNPMPNSIRSLCNSDIKEGFQFGKDVSLPETYVRSAQNPLRQLGGKSPSKRQFLAFFAGSMHGYLRPILLNYWENKDPEMKIFGKLRKVKGEMTYAQYMKSSKYCICAKGYEVNSPRVVEAIFYECVPVIISDDFVPPFFETLNWESFAVFVLEKDIPNLKSILQSIPKKRYNLMQERVKKVQQHFLWHSKPVKYDVFHMILHSIWYNRVFQTGDGNV